METFTEPRALVKNDRYTQDRQAVLDTFDPGSIDDPIVDIIRAFALLPHCFTLQSCYGHFVCNPEQDCHTLDPVPRGYSRSVRYRIAYLAVCVENSLRGKALLKFLGNIPAIDPGCVQFGSADWFWESWANSYALQVEPARYMTADEAILQSEEALLVQHTRDRFFSELRKLVGRELRAQQVS